MFGTYGIDNWLWPKNKYNFDKCKTAAPAWQGDNFRTSSASQQSLEKNITNSQSKNKEIALYDKYYSNSNSIAAQVMKSSNGADLKKEIFSKYTDELFALIIHEHLGYDFPESNLKQLIEFKRLWSGEKHKLSKDLSNGIIDREVYLDQLNNIFNGLADDCKTVLNSQEYEKLFQVGYNDKFDIRDLITN